MSSAAQRAELQSKIWKIANDVRGSVDGWDFKQYVLGTLFYRFISENFSNYIEGGDESIKYAELDDGIITKEIKEDAIKTKGYFIYPSQLFDRIAKSANANESLNTELKTIFDAIESSANGYPSELDIKGVEELDFGKFEDNQIDLFGDAYEYLISNYAANAGKSGGEFFTPQSVSKLIAKLAIHKQTTINKIYDPAAGSGSLLLQAKKQFDAIVSNPPYSINWIGGDDPTLINDDRFAPAGVLAPNLFYGTSIAVNILVLSKHKNDTKTQFIDASGEEFYKKETNNNVLTDEHIEKILKLFDNKEEIDYVSKSIDNDKIAEENYNLSIGSYVEAKDTREEIDINVLNSEIKTTMAKIDKLRAEIDKIILGIEV